jgi:2-polyprenyl-3-methyl-5-hydroxy-6-metoxy-1,4-benzoquinol methylase
VGRIRDLIARAGLKVPSNDLQPTIPTALRADPSVDAVEEHAGTGPGTTIEEGFAAGGAAENSLGVPDAAATVAGSSAQEESTEQQIVAERWSAMPVSDNFSPEVYWLAVKAVHRRQTQMGTGGLPYRTWSQYCVGEFLSLPAERMLNVGCGGGVMDRELASMGAFVHMDSIDPAPATIDRARAEAEREGFTNISYTVATLDTFDTGRERYDAVWFSGSLHHIRKLEETFEQLRVALKPGGFIFANEYVGASRFDLPERQKEVIRAAWTLLPQEKYRYFHGPLNPGTYQPVQIPDPEEVTRADPSEAVRSSEIIPLMREYFDIVTINPMGGSILQFLLSGIAGNFRGDDPASMKLLEMLFNIEDTLAEVGDVPPDFAVIVARKPGELSQPERAGTSQPAP